MFGLPIDSLWKVKSEEDNKWWNYLKINICDRYNKENWSYDTNYFDIGQDWDNEDREL